MFFHSLLFLCLFATPNTFAAPNLHHGALIHRAGGSFTNTSIPIASLSTSSSSLLEESSTSLGTTTSSATSSAAADAKAAESSTTSSSSASSSTERTSTTLQSSSSYTTTSLTSQSTTPTTYSSTSLSSTSSRSTSETGSVTDSSSSSTSLTSSSFTSSSTSSSRTSTSTSPTDSSTSLTPSVSASEGNNTSSSTSTQSSSEGKASTTSSAFGSSVSSNDTREGDEGAAPSSSSSSTDVFNSQSSTSIIRNGTNPSAVASETQAAATTELQITAQDFTTLSAKNDTAPTAAPSRSEDLLRNSASAAKLSSTPLPTNAYSFENNSLTLNKYGGLNIIDLPKPILGDIAPNLTQSSAPVITGTPDFDMSILDSGIVGAIFKLNSSQALSWDKIPWDQLQETINGTFYFGPPLPNNQSYQVMSLDYSISTPTSSPGSNVTYHPPTANPDGGPPPSPPNYSPTFGNYTNNNNTAPPGGGGGGGSATPPPPPPPTVGVSPPPGPPPPTNLPGNNQPAGQCSGTYTGFETTDPAPGQPVLTVTYTVPVADTAPNYCASVYYVYRPLPSKAQSAPATGTNANENAGTTVKKTSLVPSYINTPTLAFGANLRPPQATPVPPKPAPEHQNPSNKVTPPDPSPASKPKGNPDPQPSKKPDNGLLGLIPIVNIGNSGHKDGGDKDNNAGLSDSAIGVIIANAFGGIPRDGDDSKGGKGKNPPSSNPDTAPSPSESGIGAIIANAFGGNGHPAQGSGDSHSSGDEGGPAKPSKGTVDGITFSVEPNSVVLNGHDFPTNKPQSITMPNGQTITIGPETVSIGDTIIPIPGQSKSSDPSSSSPQNDNPTEGTVHGVSFSLNPDTVVINGQTFSPHVPQTMTLSNGQNIAIGPEGIDIAGTFIPIPSTPTDSNKGSSGSKPPPSNGNSANDGSPNSSGSKDTTQYTNNLKPSGTINGIPYSIASSGVVINGQTLSPSKPTTISLPGGHTAEVGPGGLSVDNIFVPIDSGNTPYSGAPSSGVIDGVAYSFTPNAISVNGQSYSLSQPSTITLVGGHTLEIGSGGQVKINELPVPLPGSGDAGISPSGKAGGVHFSYSPGTINIDGHAYSLETPITTTISNGQSLVISPTGGVQVGGITIPNTNLPTGSHPLQGVINGVPYSVSPGSIEIGGTSYSLTTPTSTKLPTGQTLSIKPDGTVQINGQNLDSLSPANYGNIHGVSYSLNPSGTITVAGTTISAAIPTSITLPNGHTILIASSGAIAIDNIVIHEPQSFITAIAAAPTPTTVNGLTLSVGKSLVVIDGTTFTETPGARPTTITKGSKTITVGPSGVVLDHTTVPLRGTSIKSKSTKHTSTVKSTSKQSVTSATAAAAPTHDKAKSDAAGGFVVGVHEKLMLGFATGLACLGFLLF